MQNYHSVAHVDGYKTKVYGRNLIPYNNLKQIYNTIYEYSNHLPIAVLYICKLWLSIWIITASIKGKDLFRRFSKISKSDC